MTFERTEDTLLTGDMLLACTDGFYHHLSESDADGMYQTMIGGADPQSVLARQAQTMTARGERDNLSAVAAVFAGAVGTPQAAWGADTETTRL